MSKINESAIPAEVVLFALNAANAVRQAFQQPVLSELPNPGPEARRNPASCVLAAAFNFDCQVDVLVPYTKRSSSLWHYTRPIWVAFISQKHADAAQLLADALGTGLVHPDELGAAPYVKRHFNELAVVIPTAVADIAILFDEGELFEESV